MTKWKRKTLTENLEGKMEGKDLQREKWLRTDWKNS